MANNNVTVLNGITATAVALVLFIFGSHAIQGIFVTGFTKTIPICTRNEIQFIADY